jgi:hypothetical protein
MSHDLILGLVIGYGTCRALGALGAYPWWRRTRTNTDRPGGYSQPITIDLGTIDLGTIDGRDIARVVRNRSK